MNARANDWPDRLFETLKRGGIRQVGYVPDAGHARLIDRCRADDEIQDVVLTTEEEGVALAAGAWLGGAVITHGLGLGALTWVAALLPLAALAVAGLALRLDRPVTLGAPASVRS